MPTPFLLSPLEEEVCVHAACVQPGCPSARKAHILTVPQVPVDCSPCGRRAERINSKESFLFFPTWNVLGILIPQYILLLSTAVGSKNFTRNKKFFISPPRERARRKSSQSSFLFSPLGEIDLSFLLFLFNNRGDMIPKITIMITLFLEILKIDVPNSIFGAS